jgi:hypothetical protein
MAASKATQIRVPIVEKLERVLVQWTEHHHQRAIPLFTIITQAKQLKF